LRHSFRSWCRPLLTLGAVFEACMCIKRMRVETRFCLKTAVALVPVLENGARVLARRVCSAPQSVVTSGVTAKFGF